MTPDPFHEMQKAVDIVGGSPHPENKIAATLFGTDSKGRPFSLSRTNYWPDVIREKVGTETRIGNSSGTVHAETACIMHAPRSDGASLCITDPFCPNCAKNMAEAGIRTVYIDHKGFQKDFVARRGNAFETMSMKICEKAGINVFELWRKEERLIPILQFSPSYRPGEPCAVEREIFEAQPDEQVFSRAVLAVQKKHEGRKIATALATGETGICYLMTARAYAAVGYDLRTDSDEIRNPQGKYTYIQEPVSRILMQAARRGLRVMDGYVYATRIPTAREQVNMIGAGVRSMYVGNMTAARDEAALEAMQVLRDDGVMTFSSLPV